MSKAKTDAAEIKHTGISRVLVAYLKERLETCKDGLIIANEDSILHLQGRARELTELIQFFE